MTGEEANQELEIARELWQAHVFAHHADDIDGKVKLQDEWERQCELVLCEEMGMYAYCLDAGAAA